MLPGRAVLFHPRMAAPRLLYCKIRAVMFRLVILCLQVFPGFLKAHLLFETLPPTMALGGR